MKIKFTDREVAFLKKTLIEEKNLYKLLFDNIQSDNSIDLDDSISIDLQEWVIKKLQKIGFDKDYKLTPEGEICEDLIDLLNW